MKLSAVISTVVPAAIIAGDYETLGLTLAQIAGQTTDIKMGQLLVELANGKYGVLTAAETTVALGATTEVIKDNLATTDLVIPFRTAQPPIPGTVTLATTADGSATVLKELGTDNGRGAGVGADGRFIIDYETGIGTAYLTTAPTATNDLKAGYKHRTPPATAKGLPSLVLLEDVPFAQIAAADVLVTGVVTGRVRKSGLVGYSDGYFDALRRRGLIVV